MTTTDEQRDEQRGESHVVADSSVIARHTARLGLAKQSSAGVAVTPTRFSQRTGATSSALRAYDEPRDTYDTYDERMLPQNVDAEANVLGAVLIDPEILPQLARWLTPDMFYRDAHRETYHAMLNTLRLNATYAPDAPGAGELLAVVDELERMGADVDASYVSSLATRTPTSANWETYARIVDETALQRTVIRAAGDIAALAYRRTEPNVLRQACMKLLSDSFAQMRQTRGRWLADVLAELLVDIDARVAGEQGRIMLPTGFASIDMHIGGMELGDLVILAARPGIGKSMTALRLMRSTLDELNTRGDTGSVLYLSLEMSELRQVRRMVASAGQIHGLSLRNGFHDPVTGEVDAEALAHAYETVAELEEQYGYRARFDDARTSIASLDDVIGHAVAEYDTRVVIVDQLDLIQSDDPRARYDEYSRVSAAVDELKQLAMQYGIVVICLAQLKREGANVRPELIHLRSSGRIEQNADYVFFLHRPFDVDPEASSDAHYPYLLELWIAKAREARKNVMVPLMLLDSYTSVEPWPSEWPVPAQSTSTSTDVFDAFADTRADVEQPSRDTSRRTARRTRADESLAGRMRRENDKNDARDERERTARLGLDGQPRSEGE